MKKMVNESPVSMGIRLPKGTPTYKVTLIRIQIALVDAWQMRRSKQDNLMEHIYKMFYFRMSSNCSCKRILVTYNHPD